MTSPAASLREPPQPSTKRIITESFWGAHTYVPISQAYWNFYNEACLLALRDGGTRVVVRTHQDLIDTVDALKADSLREATRDVLRPLFTKPHVNKQELIDRSIDLAAKLLLMVDFGTVQNGLAGRRTLQWNSGSLRECVSLGFDPNPTLDHKDIKLQLTFNARSLALSAGLKIVATSNLLDHLRLTNNDMKLHVFHHASFLRHQTQGSLLPAGLAEETLRTLSLLFPESDKKLRSWYNDLPAPFSLDTELVRCDRLNAEDRQLENFTYWHDRLVVLKQVFDEATPQDISQWWHDRRNSVQWWTFWVAILVLILTIVFGLIQCITGIMQVYAAFNPKL